jgi:chromosome segregation ATPase
MDVNTITLIGAVVITPVVTLLTLWVKNIFAKDARRDKRDDGYISSLTDRVETCERRHNERDKEMREIRAELKQRDEEYVNLYKEHTTIRAKYDVLLADHNELKEQYDATAVELAALKDAIKKDRALTSDLAAHTASNVA